MSKREVGARRAEREQKKAEQRIKALDAAGGVVHENCPCPQVNCVNYKLCTPCREKHKNTPPYCERG